MPAVQALVITILYSIQSLVSGTGSKIGKAPGNLSEVTLFVGSLSDGGQVKNMRSQTVDLGWELDACESYLGTLQKLIHHRWLRSTMRKKGAV